MKHFWISVTMLAAVLAACLVSLSALDRTMDGALACLDRAEEQAAEGNYPAAVEAVQDCLSLWEDHKGLCGTLLRHDEADDIYFTLCQLDAYARMEQEEFFGLLAQTKAMLEHIKEMERPSYYNFL